MSKRKQLEVSAPGIVFGDGGIRFRTNNHRKWVSFGNGAQRISNWNSEHDVAQLGYDPDTDAPGFNEGVKFATFTTRFPIGPTASAICTEIDLESEIGRA